ncbi:hypothetical protein J8L98_02705 [Pseudoalteromonas sp. MMG013]|uniref:glycosyl hydrolase family 28-related protein n=1 Tax=Pseudoalteromonas sp. MMG013 TaxID=2822687 RepID=UPI001B385CF3|nr:glycosyl hydrolase family 28-related protein [Pseudoalteromonas sp. MMG013]MBQ4860605.1 hypothetical protein [Pseudoalteromonas sp. MMG013]
MYNLVNNHLRYSFVIFLLLFPRFIYAAEAQLVLTWSPSTIAPGQQATLAWTARNVKSCLLDGVNHGFGGGWTGTYHEGWTSNYECLTHDGDKVSTSATLTVKEPPPTVYLTWSPSVIEAGQKATLSWSGNNVENCLLDGVNHGFGGGWTGTYFNDVTANYVCKGKDGSTAQTSATLTVKEPPPTVYLTWSPSVIEAGQKATLSWSGNNVESCLLDGVNHGFVGGWTGTYYNDLTANYVCQGKDGSIAQISATLTVNPPPAKPSVTLYWSPSVIDYAQEATLTWQSSNATSCKLDNVDHGLYGGRRANYNKGHTSELVCSGPGGTTSTTAKLIVKPQAILEWVPNRIKEGGSANLAWSSKNAISCLLDGVNHGFEGGWASHPTEGRTSTYECLGHDNTKKTVTATLIVVPKSPTDFELIKQAKWLNEHVEHGGKGVFAWESIAENCQLTTKKPTNDVSSEEVNGTGKKEFLGLKETTTVTLECSINGATSKISKTINVAPPTSFPVPNDYVVVNGFTTTAIKEAVQGALKETNKVIYFPEGNYTIDETINIAQFKKETKIVGSGVDKTKIVIDSAVDVAFKLSNFSDVSGISFEGQMESGSIALKLARETLRGPAGNGNHGGRFNNLSFKNLGEGINAEYSLFSEFKHITMDNVTVGLNLHSNESPSNWNSFNASDGAWYHNVVTIDDIEVNNAHTALSLTTMATNVKNVKVTNSNTAIKFNWKESTSGLFNNSVEGFESIDNVVGIDINTAEYLDITNSTISSKDSGVALKAVRVSKINTNNLRIGSNQRIEAENAFIELSQSIALDTDSRYKFKLSKPSESEGKRGLYVKVERAGGGKTQYLFTIDNALDKSKEHTLLPFSGDNREHTVVIIKNTETDDFDFDFDFDLEIRSKQQAIYKVTYIMQ